MIDTSILSTIGENSRFEPFSGEDKGILPKGHKNEPETATGRSKQGINSALQREADKRKAERERYREGIAKQQDAIRKSGTLRSEILKGIKQGEDTALLLIKACECISLQTGDSQYYKQAENDIRTIYGTLGNEPLIQEELNQTKERLARLESALETEQDTDRKQRLLGTVQSHRKHIKDIEESLRK